VAKQLSRIGWLICVAALFAFAQEAAAQASTGRLAGTVFDTSGAVLPGTSVTASNGATGVAHTEFTNERGAFVFASLPVGTYKVSVELAGFKTATYSEVIINVGQEYSLTSRLEVGTLSETVEVTAGVSLVKTTTPEVSSTVQQAQVLAIPLANRDVTNLIKAQAGVVGIPNRSNTVINGGRPSWTQVTLDGINIQDNFIRVNSLDFLPNRPTSDSVAEFSVTSSVQGADAAGGASSVRMVTPSGTNQFRGSVFEFRRDNEWAANSFFNNRAIPAVPKSDLKRDQFGGRLGGPILRNKLFFFGYYEGFRQTTQPQQNLMVPASSDLLDGVFRYVATSDQTVRSVNVVQLSGLPIDPKLRTDFLSKIPRASNVNNYDIGNSRADRILNTAGYRYNQTDLNNRDQFGVRMDYEMSANHRLEGIYSYFKETDDRTDLDAVTTEGPLVYTSSDTKRLSLAWRWLASSRFQNEVRYGFNLAPVQFVSDWDYSGIGVVYNTALGLANPLGGYGTGGATAAFQPQGRYTNTYQVSDNGSLVLGAHELQIGGSWQRNRVNPYNYVGIYPTVNFGFSSAAPTSVQLTSAMFPGGISASDLTSANALAAFLGGIVTSTQRTYNVVDASSGYVPGVPSDENYTFDNVAAYIQDNWRWKPTFTVRAGLKWEYYSPLREDNNLGFLPVTNGRAVDQFMLDPSTTVTFTDGDYWRKDLNNFGPTVGFAWDVTKDGRTAVRGGYSLTFVNEETVTVGRNAARGNTGLTNTPVLSNQYTSVSAGVPQIPTPVFLPTRTLANQMATSATAVLWGIDPEITSPQVHQVSFGIQRELPWSMAVEARFVGSYGRDIWRGIDYNQVKISQEFLADFLRGRTNGYLAQQAGLAYSPLYNPAVPGSQQLTLLPSFGVNLNGATAVSNFQTNQVAGLADLFLTSRSPLALPTFMQNSGIYSANAILNGGFSDYNALQLELRRQYRSGFFGQVNYTFANSSTDSTGTAQNRFEAFMDNNRPGLDTGRAVFHVTHVINANGIYELPFGQGRRFLDTGGLLDQIVGGWQVSGVFTWQSGSPLTIYSGRGTFNRAGRSGCGGTGCNTAVSTLSADELKKLLGIYEANGNIYWIDPKVIGTDGRGVGTDNLTNAATYAGQIFFNPVAGEVGNLGLLEFDGPAQFRIDLAVSKRFRMFDRYRLEFKGEAFNLTNTPSFFRGDMDINNQQFGRITSVNVGARVVQLSARFEF
jgi:hypothetical protein